MHCRTNELEFLRFPLFPLDIASPRSTPPSTSFATSSPRNAISRTLPRFDFPVPRFDPPPRGSTPPAGPPPRSPSSTTSSRAPPSILPPRGDPPPPPRPGRPFRGRFASRRRWWSEARARRFQGDRDRVLERGNAAMKRPKRRSPRNWTRSSRSPRFRTRSCLRRTSRCWAMPSFLS